MSILFFLLIQVITNNLSLPDLQTTSMGIVIYPAGLKNILKHIKDEYMDPEIYIMENGNE